MFPTFLPRMLRGVIMFVLLFVIPAILLRQYFISLDDLRLKQQALFGIAEADSNGNGDQDPHWKQRDFPVPVSNVEMSLMNAKWTWKGLVNRLETSFPAHIPGDIFTDLHVAGFIPDPLSNDTDTFTRWVGEQDWTLSCEFKVSDNVLSKMRRRLVLDGLDTVATVSLNGAHILHANNAFRTYRVDVTHKLQRNNLLIIKFQSAVRVAGEKQREYKEPAHYCWPNHWRALCDVNFVRKMQASFGWDWSPAYPLVGIWRYVGLDLYNYVRLEHVKFYPQFSNATKKWSAKVGIVLTLPNHMPQSSNLVVETKIENLQLHVNIPFSKMTVVESKSTLKEFRFTFFDECQAPIKPWWTFDLGEPWLYNLSVALLWNEEHVDARIVRVGFREMQLKEDPLPDGGNTFFFTLNGVGLFMRGANWIPFGIFPWQESSARYSQHLLAVREANMNMIRVWGGGQYERDYFYELCDALGILVWQEAAFASLDYPHEPEFLANVREEMIDNVHRLQYHASLAAWSGNNEIGLYNGYNYPAYAALFKDVVLGTIEALDPGKPMVISSPSNGKIDVAQGHISNAKSPLFGDVHWYFHDGDMTNTSTHLIARFLSEFGMQSLPSLETWKIVSTDPQQWSPISPLFNTHQHLIDGNKGLLHKISQQFGPVPTTPSAGSYRVASYLSQLNQALIYKTYIHNLRRHQCSSPQPKKSTIQSGSPHVSQQPGQYFTMGSLYWQLNDVWPGPTWSSLETTGKWKVLHYFARRFYLPNRITAHLDKAEDMVEVNYIFTPRNSIEELRVDISVELLCYNFNTFLTLKPTVRWDVSKTVSCPVVNVFREPVQQLMTKCGCQSRENCLLMFNLLDSQTAPDVLSNDWLLLVRPKNLTVAKNKVTLQVTVTESPNHEQISQLQPDATHQYLIQIESSQPTVFVYLDPGDMAGWFSDNAFPLVNRVTSVHFTWMPTPNSYHRRAPPTPDQVKSAIRLIDLSAALQWSTI